jgi:hypothetical protein
MRGISAKGGGSMKIVTILKKIWEAWQAFGRFIGNQVARVALSIFYFTIFAPFGLGVRWRSDPLQIKTTPDNLWRERSTTQETVAEAGRQF